MKIRLNINSEFEALREAIIGLPNTFNQTGRLEAINPTEELYFDTLQAPRRSALIKEVHSLARVLRENDVKVHYPKPLGGTIDQLTPRDLGFIVGNTFVVSHMAYRIREREEKGIVKYLRHFDGRIVKAPHNVVVEGGDVLLDGENMYVGVGRRTNNAGYEYVKKLFGDRYRVYRMMHKALHLDLVFNILGGGRALTHPNGVKYLPERVLDKFKLIKVPAGEYEKLAVNTLSLSKDKVISRTSCVKTNKKLRDNGYEVIEVEFNEVPKTGGSFRCCTMPLTRCE
jgi:N-dimethylarginine dimethylaminohydrolase